MADTSRERSGEFVQRLFEILIASPEGLRGQDAIKVVEEKIALTPYEQGEYESGGGRRFDKILRFATVDCVKAGWMQKQSGIWSITEAGVSAYKKFKVPGDLYREATRLYRVWKVGQDDKGTESEPAIDEPSYKKTSVTFEEAEDQAREEIRQYLGKLNPYDFQELVGDLLAAMGYYVSWIAPPGKDGGVDIIAHPDVLGTQAPRIKVQVKRTDGSKINADGVRAFLALINDDDVGLYVALGGFTKDAEDFARNQERRRVTLISLDRFNKLWIEHYPKLSDTARKHFPLSPIWFLTPND